MGSSIELSNSDMNVFLKESAYMFRTIIGDFVSFLKMTKNLNLLKMIRV